MKEVLLIIPKITLKKLINVAKVYISYLFSVYLKRNKRFGLPISISIEPTSVCNLKCPECPTGLDELTRYKGHIDFNIFKKAVDELSPYLINLILYFQGEPFLNKDIFKLIEYSSLQKKIFTTSSTNGHFLDIETSKKIIKSGLNKLIISIDGTTQDIYEKYRRNGSFETVIQGVKNITSAKKELKSRTPFIVVQFLVFKFNKHQIPEIKKLSKELNVDKLELKSAQVYNFENDVDFIPKNSKYSRYKKNKQGVYKIKSKLKNKCKRLWFSSVITNTGEVLPCCFDKDAKYSFGNINTYKFKNINNNNKSLRFRNILISDRKQIDICKNCTEGLKI